MVALERAGIKVEKYTAYEIDENAIKISHANYPQIEHKGDVFKAEYSAAGRYVIIAVVAGLLLLLLTGKAGREKSDPENRWQNSENTNNK